MRSRSNGRAGSAQSSNLERLLIFMFSIVFFSILIQIFTVEFLDLAGDSANNRPSASEVIVGRNNNSHESSPIVYNEGAAPVGDGAETPKKESGFHFFTGKHNDKNKKDNDGPKDQLSFLEVQHLKAKKDHQIKDVEKELTVLDHVELRDINEILDAANVKATKEQEKNFPPKSDVEEMYGSHPIILGLDRCEEYRSKVKPAEAYIGPAGMFNTGTNLLYKMLKRNCEIPEKIRKYGEYSKPIRFQPPWGKHSPVTWRNQHIAQVDAKGVIHSDFLPAAVIKDPYTWMNSMCRHSYTANWPHTNIHCPNLVPLTPFEKRRNRGGDESIQVRVRYSDTTKIDNDSLVHLWNDWYSEWLDVDFPRLIVRYEDLLFHAEEVVTQVCECGGGTMKDHDFVYIEASAKEGAEIHDGAYGLVKSISTYADKSLRFAEFQEPDMKFASKTLRKDLMEVFRYKEFDWKKDKIVAETFVEGMQRRQKPKKPVSKIDQANTAFAHDKLDFTKGGEFNTIKDVRKELTVMSDVKLRNAKNVLAAAKVALTEDEEKNLPHIADVKKMYGSHPIILGLDRCEEFRGSVDPAESFIAPAGMFNSGTNLLYEMLHRNCHIPERVKKYGEKSRGMRDQVPWGKHTPVSWRGGFVSNTGKKVFAEDFLAAAVIKDPYTWMDSMCRHWYEAEWPHRKNHCPNLVPLTPFDKSRSRGHDVIGVHIKYRDELVTRHKSLADLWNDWYGPWLDAEFPRLMVRFEDLLYHAEEVVTKVCECGGGKMADGEFQYVEESAKQGAAHENANGLTKALNKYGDASKRFKSFKKPDLEYAEKTIRKDILEFFRYENYKSEE